MKLRALGAPADVDLFVCRDQSKRVSELHPSAPLKPLTLAKGFGPERSLVQNVKVAAHDNDLVVSCECLPSASVLRGRLPSY